LIKCVRIGKEMGGIVMSEYNEFENNNDFQSSNNEFEYKGNNNFGKPKTMGWSIVAFVAGLVSVICCCLGISGIILGAVAIIASILSRKTLGYFDGLSVAGLILGIFGLVFGIVFLAAVMLVGDEEFEKYMEEFNKIYGEMYPEV
jgi:hypothetical protein